MFGLSSIKIYALLFGTVALLSVFMYQFYQIGNLEDRNNSLTKDLTMLEQFVKTQSTTITVQKGHIERLINVSNDLDEKKTAAKLSESSKREELASYSKRLSNAAIKKTKLVQRLINRNIGNVLRKFSEETGGEEPSSSPRAEKIP